MFLFKIKYLHIICENIIDNNSRYLLNQLSLTHNSNLIVTNEKKGNTVLLFIYYYSESVLNKVFLVLYNMCVYVV